MGDKSKRRGLERQDRCNLLKIGRDVVEAGQNHRGGMSLCELGGGATVSAADSRFRLFHFGPHGMQIVGG